MWSNECRLWLDVAVDSVDKRCLKLLVRSSDPVSCMTRVGRSSAVLDDSTVNNLTPNGSSSIPAEASMAQANESLAALSAAVDSTNWTLWTTPGAPTGGGSHASFASPQSRQIMAKQSPSALQPRQQSTLWNLTLVFESEDDCVAAAKHIELRRYALPQRPALSRVSHR